MKSGDKAKLLKKKYSFTDRSFYPAGTEVQIVKIGKRAASDRAQVRTACGHKLVVRLDELEEEDWSWE